MAIACLGFVTRFFDRPERKVPCLNSCITSAIFLLAPAPYFPADLLLANFAAIYNSSSVFRNANVPAAMQLDRETTSPPA